MDGGVSLNFRVRSVDGPQATGGPSVDAVTELVARDRIHQLADRYALAVDAKDLQSLSALFVEDVDNGRYGSGRDGVEAFYDERLQLFHCSMHLVGNHVIDFDDDLHAHGVVYCRAQHHVTEPEHWFDMALAYWDVYEKQGDEWLFRRRRVKSWYRQEIGYPGHPAERVLSAPADQGSMRGVNMPHAFPTFDEFWSGHES
jgi:hypothetical protein